MDMGQKLFAAGNYHVAMGSGASGLSMFSTGMTTCAPQLLMVPVVDTPRSWIGN